MDFLEQEGLGNPKGGDRNDLKQGFLRLCSPPWGQNHL